MRCRIFVLGCMAALLPCMHAQQSSSARWAGVWQGELNGHPGVTLTLAQDTGDLGGTIVLYVISKEVGSPQTIASEVHVIMHPHVDGDALLFQVKRLNDSGEIQMEVKLNENGKAQLRCLNCGTDSPTTELVRYQP